MKITRRRFLGILLAGCIAAWLVLVGLERHYQEGANYSRIEDGLYMGGAVAEPPPGTTAVLNLCELKDPYGTDNSLWEPIPDRAPAPSIDWLRRMVAFVAAKRQAGLTTFVHCRMGASRSGMVVVAYLMSRNHWTRDRALAFVRSKRPQTRPNPAFMERLLDWERELKVPPRTESR
jgi:hypothetical protein